MRQIIKLTTVGFLDINDDVKILPKELYHQYLLDNPGWVPIFTEEYIHEITLEDRKAVSVKIAQ